VTIPSVKQILIDLGPSLSSEVRKVLEKHGIPADTARKRIQRAKGTIKYLKDVTFPHNEQFLYVENQVPAPVFRTALVKAFDKTNSCYGIAINSIRARKGVIPKSHFGIISGSPTNIKGHINSESILQSLIDLEILECSSLSIGECIHLSNQNSDTIDLKTVKAKLEIEKIILDGFKEWIKKLGLVSYKRVSVRGDTNRNNFGSFEWDINAPSYTHPFVRFDKSGSPIPGFLVGDVIWSSIDKESQIRYFLNKCRIIRNNSKNRPFIAFLIAKRFAKDAFDRGRKEGLIFTTPANLFGKEVSEGFSKVFDLFSTNVAGRDNLSENIEDIFTKFENFESIIGNLRGKLFEMIVADSVNRSGCTVDIGVNITDPKSMQNAEIDVIAESGNHKEVAVFECKGNLMDYEVGESVVKKWVSTSIPRINNWLNSNPGIYVRAKQKRFEFWTTGKFHKDALTYLEAAKKKSKYSISWKDRKGVLSFIRQSGSSDSAKVIKLYYRK
jgi:hypothetical protein